MNCYPLLENCSTMFCFYCNQVCDKSIPMLVCGHSLHPQCYCKLKDINPNHTCLVCDKPMKRGKRKTKI